MKYFYKFHFLVYNKHMIITKKQPSMGKRGVFMKTWIFYKLKCNLIIRRSLLNLLLLFFSPSNKFIVVLSQNLDKHIVLYQKELVSIYHKQHNSNSVNKIAA